MATQAIPTDSVRLVKELYPRLKPIDEVIERYRDSLDRLPPIVVARDGVLVDGYHRWQAHVREGVDTIDAEMLGDLTESEIIRESITRNNAHGQQLNQAEKRRLAGRLWTMRSDLTPAKRVQEIGEMLSVSERSVQAWTKDARKAERDDQQAKAWDLWLDCMTVREIEQEIGVPRATIDEWLSGKRKSAESGQTPASRQHFDVWTFPTADQDAGAQSYFGALPPQVVENALWFYTEPGQIVVDPFAGSGTTVDVAKAMGRRVWASDIRGDHYSPHLPIHQHDITTGWPSDAPKKADLVLLDPPYWQQAKGRYSTEPGEMAEMDYEEFDQAWVDVVDGVVEHTNRVAYIISPTQLEDGRVVDHATAMLAPFLAYGWRIERRIIVPYSTQQATGQQVTWARENRRLLKLYRDLIVMAAP